jgi:hypothetical protein
MKISYITIGTNHREAAEVFYDQLLEGSGFEKAYSADRMTMWVKEGLSVTWTVTNCACLHEFDLA